MNGHLVEFYEHESLLVDSVTRHLLPALSDHSPAIIVATPEHRRAFVAALAEAGVDVAAARSNGLLVTLDAARTLDTIMVGRSPSPGRFDRVIGKLVREAAAEGATPAIFGEMVALLWEQGNRSAALQLEKLWCRLAEATPFCLLCAYPLSQIDWNGDTTFRAVCGTHTGVKLRFRVPTPAQGPPVVDNRPAGSGLGSLLEALNNAHQAGRMATPNMRISRSVPDGLDYQPDTQDCPRPQRGWSE